VTSVVGLWSTSLFLTAAAIAQEPGVPPTWSEASHGNDAAPDYDRLFAMDRVHDLHIEIAPEDFEAMREDLATVAPGMPGMPLGAAGPAAGFAPPGAASGAPVADIGSAFVDRIAAAASACENKSEGAACTVDNGTEGQCAAFGNLNLTCLPAEMLAFVEPDGSGVPGGFIRPIGAGGAGRPGGPGARGGTVVFGGQAPDLTSRDPIYVPVTVTHDGRVWSGVGMRYKGNSSLMTARMSGNGKVPFRLDFDRYEDDMPEIRNQRFYGFDKLTFSSNFSDDSLLKEVLATEVFRDRGVPAARAAFYRVFVDTGNGEQYWGLYTMIEDPADGAMLDAQFADDSGNLYKPDGRGANWVTFDAESFNKKTNEKAADYSDVASAYEALHGVKSDPAEWREELEARFDVDLFLRWLAVNSVIENWDSYGRMAHNYYLYADPGDGGRLKWIPWDHNMAFGMAGGGFGRGIGGGGPGVGGARFGGGGPGGAGQARGAVPAFTLPPGIENIVREGAVAFFGMNGGDDVLHSEAGEAWPLISRILSDAVYAAKYRDELERALGGLFETEAFTQRARELQAMITPYAIGQQGELPTHTTLTSPGAFMQALDGPSGLLARVDARRERVRAALDAVSAAKPESANSVSEP
jgi:hypothetical protein